jgi:hypothetical protein
VSAREEADGKAALCFFKRVTGYAQPIEKIFVSKDGEVIRVQTEEHIPPDVRAGETWLYNRQPAKWKRDRSVDAKSEERELTIKIVGGLPE